MIKRVLLFTLSFTFGWSLFGQEYLKKPANEYNFKEHYYGKFDWGFGQWKGFKSKFPVSQVYQIPKEKMISSQEIYQNKPIVIEMGSMTCRSYASNIKSMKELHEKYGDRVDFYTLYIRENHPTRKYQARTSSSRRFRGSGRRRSNALATTSWSWCARTEAAPTDSPNDPPGHESVSSSCVSRVLSGIAIP